MQKQNQQSRLWVLISGALAIIIVFGGYVFVGKPLLEWSSTLDKELIENRSTLTIEEAKLASLSRGESGGDLEARVAELQKAIPTTLSDPLFFAQVNQARVAAGVEVSSITIDTAQATPTGTATGYGVSIAGSGAEASSLAFLRNLQEADRLILIKSVDFSGSGDSYSFTVTATIFQVAPVVAATAAAPATQ